MTKLVSIGGTGKAKPVTERGRMECTNCSIGMFGLVCCETAGQPDVYELVCLSCDTAFVLEGYSPPEDSE